MQCPYHKVLIKMLLKIFYRELDQLSKMVVDNVSGGTLVKLSYGVTTTLLHQVLKQNKG